MSNLGINLTSATTSTTLQQKINGATPPTGDSPLLGFGAMVTIMAAANYKAEFESAIKRFKVRFNPFNRSTYFTQQDKMGVKRLTVVLQKLSNWLKSSSPPTKQQVKALVGRLLSGQNDPVNKVIDKVYTQMKDGNVRSIQYKRKKVDSRIGRLPGSERDIIEVNYKTPVGSGVIKHKSLEIERQKGFHYGFLITPIRAEDEPASTTNCTMDAAGKMTCDK